MNLVYLPRQSNLSWPPLPTRSKVAYPRRLVYETRAMSQPGRKGLLSMHHRHEYSGRTTWPHARRAEGEGKHTSLVGRRSRSARGEPRICASCLNCRYGGGFGG